ncbi:MAG: hypothetical protein Ct9H90mP11_01390 [Acidimicrobiales bacterium]|nr:MAG: hypothetical protein Ct9H90mP11_01390 [Acidimicrobiales bacterium]
MVSKNRTCTRWCLHTCNAVVNRTAGLNGFVGEFLILLGTFTANRWWAVIAATGVILAALYLLWAYQRVFHGPQNQEDEPTKDLTNWERLTLLPLIVALSFWVSTLNQCLTA